MLNEFYKKKKGGDSQLLNEGDIFDFIDSQTGEKTQCDVLLVLPKGENSHVIFTDNNVVNGEQHFLVGEYNHKKKEMRATDENESTKNILFALLKKMEKF